MSVVGIDFGSDSSFLAVVNSKGATNIVYVDGSRATPSYVAFNKRGRVSGVAAKEDHFTNLENTAFGFKRYLGRRFNDERIQEDKSLVPYKIVKPESGPGKVGIQVKCVGEDKVYTPEQLTAMLFIKLKKEAENKIRTTVHDCVISVPSYFTDFERRAILDAAQIAGLHPLRLMNDTTAAALNYGLSHQDLPERCAPPRYVAIVDCGYSAFQVAIVAISKEKLGVLATNSDIDLGGRQLAAILLRHIVNQFPSHKKVVESFQNNLPELRLRWYAKAKMLIKEMSKSLPTVPVKIPYILTGDGGEGNAITRNDFEEACATFFEDMEQALLTCLEDSEIHVADLHSVELLGGTSQIPAISSLIERVLGRAPSKTLNPSEAVARGCAMQCAILSPSTSNLVRSNYQIIDVQPYPIELKWIFPSGQIGGTEIFALHSPVPDVSSSSLLCPAAKKTAFKVAYGDNEFHPRKTIGKFIIDLNHENDHPCVFTVHFSLNIHGMLSVDKATVDQVVGLHMGETFSIMDLNSDEEMPAGAADLLEVGATTEVPREEHSSIRDVPVDSRPVHGLSRSELEAMILEESRFVALDKLEEERQARRTNLVATMLCMKGVLDGYLKRFVNEEQDRLDEYFTNLEHWLSHEGKNVDGEAFDQKLQDLKEKVDPIKVREALYRYRKTLSDAEEAVKAYRAKRPKYAHNADLDEDDIEQISKSIEETEDWLELEEQYSPPDTFSVINNDEEAQLRSKRIEEQWLICWKNARSILNSWKLT